jgi:hypothetical protein
LDGAITAFTPGLKEPMGGMSTLPLDDDNSNSHGSIAGVFGLIGTAAHTATSVGSNAAQTATAATSWFAKRLSCKFLFFFSLQVFISLFV